MPSHAMANASTDPHSASFSRMHYAWLIVALLFPVALLNYLDRQMLSVMKSSVTSDIPFPQAAASGSLGFFEWLSHWLGFKGSFVGEGAWGLMLGQFKWVYAVLSPIGGYIADRFSRKWTICLSLFAWSAVTWMTGQVTTFEGLLWTRTMMGVSEAFYIPAALALIADYHQAHTRSRAVGIHQIGMYCGVIIGGFSGHIADSPDFGWRFAFTLAGIVGVIYAFPLLFIVRDNPLSHELRSKARNEGTSSGYSMWTVLRELFGNPSFLFLVICFTFPAMPGWIVRDWMPSILEKQFHLSQGTAGVSATLYSNIACLLAAFGGGMMADYLMKKTQRGRIYVSATGIFLLVPALFGVGNASTLVMAITFLILFGIGWGFFDCNNMPILSQIVRPELRATGYGLMNLVSISSGGFADWGFGILRENGYSLNFSFGVFATFALISVGFMLAIRPRSDLSTIPSSARS